MFSEFVEVLTICKETIEDAIESGQMKSRNIKICIGKTSKKQRAENFSLFGNKTPTKKNDSNGGKKAAERAKQLNEFRSENNSGTILLCLYVIGGIGLNLIGCHFGIFMEPIFNPQMEIQAGDRM